MTETRPRFPREELPSDIAPEELAQVEAEWNEEIESLEARGPLRFVFDDDREYGYLAFGHLNGGDNTQTMRGVVELGTYDVTYMSEGYGLSIDVLRNNPFEHVPDLVLKGVSDAHVEALCSRGVKRLDVTGGVRGASLDPESEEMAEADAEVIAEFKIHQDQWVADAQGMAAVLTDACLAYIPRDVEILRLRDTELTDGGLAAWITQSTNLLSIGLQSSRLTGEWLAALSSTSELLSIDCWSPEMTGAALCQYLPVLPEVDAASFDGERILEGFDGAELRRRLPKLVEFSINPETLSTADLYRVALQMPGVSINGVELSERAIRKAAQKQGIEL